MLKHFFFVVQIGALTMLGIGSIVLFIIGYRRCSQQVAGDNVSEDKPVKMEDPAQSSSTPRERSSLMENESALL